MCVVVRGLVRAHAQAHMYTPIRTNPCDTKHSSAVLYMGMLAITPPPHTPLLQNTRAPEPPAVPASPTASATALQTAP